MYLLPFSSCCCYWPSPLQRRQTQYPLLVSMVLNCEKFEIARGDILVSSTGVKRNTLFYVLFLLLYRPLTLFVFMKKREGWQVLARLAFLRPWFA